MCNTDVVYVYRFVRRIQMTISLPSTVNDESQIQSLFPLCIMLARPVYSPAVVEVVLSSGNSLDLFLLCHSFAPSLSDFLLMQDSAVYRFSRECILTKCTGDDAMNQDEANFILPEINKLSAEVKSGSLTILFVSCGMLFSYLVSTLADTMFANFHALLLSCS